MKRIVLFLLAVIMATGLTGTSFVHAASPKSNPFSEGTVDVGLNFGAAEALPIYEPYIGYLVADDCELGGGFFYGSAKVEGETTSSMGLDISARYYFSDHEWKDFVPYAEAGFMTHEFDDINSSRLKIGGGAKYFLTSIFAIDLKAYYGTGKVDDVTVSGFKFAAGMSVHFR